MSCPAACIVLYYIRLTLLSPRSFCFLLLRHSDRFTQNLSAFKQEVKAILV